jgi:hypothetical protein
MVVLDKDVDFLNPGQVELTDAARLHIDYQNSFMSKKFPNAQQFAVFSLGLDGPWVAFCSREELPREALSFVSEEGILFSMPLRLGADEKLRVDFAEDQFRLQGVEIDSLIPEQLRQAFLDKLGKP